MYAGKRPAYAAVSGKKKQAKQAGPAFAGAGNSAHEQHGAARFLTKPSAAAVVSSPRVLVFTFMALSAFWKQAPEISDTAKRFVRPRVERYCTSSLPGKYPLNVRFRWVYRPLVLQYGVCMK